MTPELLSRLRLKVAEELGATWVNHVSRRERFLRVGENSPLAMEDADGIMFSDRCPDWPNSLDACLRDLRCEGGQTIALIPQDGFSRAVLMEGPDALLDDPTQPGVCRALWGDEYDAPTPAVAYVLCWLASRGVDVSEFQESGE